MAANINNILVCTGWKQEVVASANFKIIKTPSTVQPVEHLPGGLPVIIGAKVSQKLRHSGGEEKKTVPS
jgi:hypothetical protein